MDAMFWVWLGVIVVTAIIEFATMEIASIWFTFGAIIPFILAATRAVGWEIQIVIFVLLSAVMIASLRNVTKKYLLRNSNEKTNIDSLIGKKYRMLSRTDFETIGSVKVNDIVWSAIGEKQQSIEKDEIVEIVKVDGNKLVVKKTETKNEEVKAEKVVDNTIEESVVKQDQEAAVKTEPKRKIAPKTEATKKAGTTQKKSTASKANKNQNKGDKK